MMTENDLSDVFTNKEYLALQQIVKAMLLKGERDSPGYIDEIRGIANMTRVSVDVDKVTWDILDHFKSNLSKLNP